MLNLIIAMTPEGGIGINGKLPWHDPEELKIFKKTTLNHILVMGRKTLESLPHLPNRTLVGLSRNTNLDTKHYKNKCVFFNTVEKIIAHCIRRHPNKKIFIAGGGCFYDFILNRYSHLISRVYLSVMKKDILCDTYTNRDFKRMYTEHTIYKKTFTHYIKTNYPPKCSNKEELQYINLLIDVIDNGDERMSRNSTVKSIFSKHLKFDLRNGFPLLTTKKMFIRGIFEELLFFIKGQTDSKILEKKKVNIWKGNTNRQFLDQTGKTNRSEGILGPMYGYQWRYFNAEYDEKTAQPLEKGIDQLENIITLIKTQPNSRRIVMTDFNPSQIHLGVLPPCHSLVLQFYVQNKFLDMFCYNRSSDLFLGLPFNIASSALLLILIAEVCNLTPRYFNLSLGDAHIYEAHYDAVKTQITRNPYNFPTLKINKKLENIKDIESMVFGDIEIYNYTYHSRIKAPMIS